MEELLDLLSKLIERTGIAQLVTEAGGWDIAWQAPVMWLIGLVFIFLAIKKDMEPLLLLPIGFSVLMVNIPLGGLTEVGGGGEEMGLFYFFYHYGLETDVVPCLIFLGLGAMTDFGPLIANPKTLVLGAAAQVGVFVAFFGALLLGFDVGEACSIGIIGGADGPTTIFTTTKLAPHILGATAVSAYSYMALVPIIQPPVIKLLTSKKDRGIAMKMLRPVNKTEKIVFPIAVALVVCLLVPAATPLISMFMLGNLMVNSGVVDRLSDTAQNALMNTVTILLGISVGATMEGSRFLSPDVIGIYAMGLIAFAIATASGVLFAKLMNLFLTEKINPLLGSAGVSAVPMAARVSHKMGQQANKKCYILMHAMGPNVAGVIGTIIAAGIFITLVGD
ncbi:MAG: sodium ion-translocating decarboxylase subunit beta [Polyangia bacterium]